MTPRFPSPLLPGLILIGLLGLIMGGPVAAQSAIPSYQVQAVDGTVATSLNEDGDVGGWTSMDGITKGIVYSPGIGTLVLPSPAMRPYAIVRDVSDRDAYGVIDVVGSAYIDILDEPGRAVRWQVNTATGEVEGPLDLGVLAGQTKSQARGANNAGTITGFSGGDAFLFTVGGLQKIDTLVGLPQDINENGMLAGYGGAQAFRWTLADGQQNLGVPDGFAFSFGLALNDSGQVAGYARTSGGTIFEQLARYTEGTGWKLLGGIGSDNEGWGINNAGSVVGHGVTGSTTTTGVRAVLYTDELGRLTYLNDLLTSADISEGWGVLRAYDINDAGQIVGYGSSLFEGGAVLLTPAGQMTAPVAATDLTATPRPATAEKPTPAIVVAWTDNSTDEQGFVVERKGPGETAFTTLLKVGTNITGIADTDLVACKAYEYRVKAVNLAGSSVYSNEAWAEAPCETVDSTPPVVEILEPADGAQVSGRVTIRAEASDNTGVVRMRVVEDNRLLCESTSGSIDCTWNTRKEAAGTHSIVVWAYDAMTNIAQQTIHVELVADTSGGKGGGGNNGNGKGKGPNK